MLGEGSMDCEGEGEEEMAATVWEDGVGGLAQGLRGCEHYDRACLSRHLVLTSFILVGCVMIPMKIIS